MPDRLRQFDVLYDLSAALIEQGEGLAALPHPEDSVDAFLPPGTANCRTFDSLGTLYGSLDADFRRSCGCVAIITKERFVLDPPHHGRFSCITSSLPLVRKVGKWVR